MGLGVRFLKYWPASWSSRGRTVVLHKGYLGVWVLLSFGVGHACEARQSHVGHQTVIEDQEGQPLSVRWPPVCHMGVKDLLCLERQTHSRCTWATNWIVAAVRVNLTSLCSLRQSNATKVKRKTHYLKCPFYLCVLAWLLSCHQGNTLLCSIKSVSSNVLLTRYLSCLFSSSS